MDRRTLIALLLAMVAIQVYFTLIVPPAQPVPEVEPTTGPIAEGPVTTEPLSAEVPDATAPPTQPDIPVRRIPLEYCEVGGFVTTAGGHLRDVELHDRKADYDAQPIWSWIFQKATGSADGAWRPYDLETGPAIILTGEAMLLGMGAGSFDAPSVRTEVVSESPGALTLRGVTADGIEIVRSMTVRDDCVIDVEVTWRNATADAYTGALWLTAHDRMGEGGGAYANVARPIGMTEGDVVRWPDLTDIEGLERYPGPVQWFGIADHYFGAYVVPEQPEGAALVFSKRATDGGPAHGEYYVLDETLAAGQATTRRFELYIGSNDLDVLRAVDESLSAAVDLGWFGFFGRILLWLLKFFYGLVGNWGIAIVALTFLVKLIFFPLTQMSFKSSQAMQALQPKLAEVREKFADNQEELNRRTIALFKEHGVNPLGGCLPMLVQMPIWIALYNVLLSSVELYQTEFLYLKDLSSADPYAVLPLIVVVLMWIQQQMMPMGNMDPAQQRIMKLMPIIFGIFFFTFPSGLVVYIFVNMVLTIVQQWLIKRQYATA